MSERLNPPRKVIRQAAVLLAVLLVTLLAGAPAQAAPAPTPAPTTSAPSPTPTPSPTGSEPAPPTAPPGPVCATKNKGETAWCMDWAVHVDKVPYQGVSHWVTQCSKASAADKAACEAVSLTIVTPVPDNTASVLRDGPPTKDGKADLIDCGLLYTRSQDSHNQPDASQRSKWLAKWQTCLKLRGEIVTGLYAPVTACDTLDVACKVSEGAEKALSNGISAGVQGIVDLVVQGTVWLLSQLATFVFTSTSISDADSSFFFVYNSIAGVMILLVFVFFLISTIINGLRTSGPGPLSSIGGLVRAILGITFAGGIAFVIVQAWDEATAALIRHNAATPWDPSLWIKGITALSGGVGTAFVALVISVFAIIGLILLFIMLLFRGLLTTGAALFGAMAMTGQVMPETRHWGRRWFWTVNALASSKFFIAALWIYGSRSAYSSDLGTSLKALLLIWVMVLTPGIMLRLTTMWDGYLSDVNARGVLSAAGNASDIGSGFAKGLSSGGGGGGPGDGAASLMNANTSGIATEPATALGEATGLEDGPGREAADAVNTGEDGGKVGDPSEAADGAAQPDAADDRSGASDTGTPNEDEADASQTGVDTAKQDVGSGQLTTPGDPSGADGSLPFAPQGSDGSPGDGSAGSADGAAGGKPTEGAAGGSPTDGDAGGAAAGGGSDGGSTAGGGSESPSTPAGAAGGGDPSPAGGGSPDSGPGPDGAPIMPPSSGDDTPPSPNGPPDGGAAPTDGGSGSGGGSGVGSGAGGSAAGGGSGGAAAADAAIVAI
jgi:hypothetical protein